MDGRLHGLFFWLAGFLVGAYGGSAVGFCFVLLSFAWCGDWLVNFGRWGGSVDRLILVGLLILIGRLDG